jgi:small subunit ribosomal protein S6
MSETRINTYEALFLFPQAAAADFGGAVEHVREILRRADAEVIALSKWDERKLAFDIKGNKRGLYFLSYFRAPAQKLAGLERDCNLSEKMLRAIVLRADHLEDEQMKAADGRQQLEDEIRLRASGAIPAPAPSPSKAPVAVADDDAGEEGDDEN